MNIIDSQKQIFGGVFLIANKLQVIGDQYLVKDDMTMKQWLLTVIISQFQSKPPTLSEVSELIGSSRQNVKQLALKLEEKEFLSIEKDEEDARALRLKLTEKCEVFWEKRKEQDIDFIKNLFSDLSEEEITTVSKAFDSIFGKILELEKSLR